MPQEPKVEWVVGRKKALARAVAILTAREAGTDWSRLTHAQRDSRFRRAEEAVTQWARDDVLALFLYPYREKDDA